MKLKPEFTGVASPKSMVDIVRDILAAEHPFDQQKEHFFALGLNAKNAVRYIDLVTLGTLDSCLVHPRESFRHAVMEGASSIVFIHNHPSGDVTPSSCDHVVTKRMISTGKILGIDVLDHIIMANETTEYYSMREQEHFDW